jgi:SAM-dependent methyltransferase
LVSDTADPDLLKFFSYRVFSTLDGAVTAGMIHLGDRLGLYRALALGPMTSAELAAATGLHERWVREWVYNQAAAKLVDVMTPDDEAGVAASGHTGEPEMAMCFSLSPEAIAVFVDESHPSFGMGMFHRLPQTMRALEQMPEVFQTGLGRDYDSHGLDGAVGIERAFEPWMNAHLVPTVLPALDGVVERLDEGAMVIDVGCGAGGAVLRLAAEFPRSQFVGFDISRYALDRAEERRVQRDLHNVTFCDPRVTPIPTDHSVDLILTFDCIHDMTRPAEMMQLLHQAISEEGTWLLVDIKAFDTFGENATHNPMASLMYGISVLSCMSSAMSEPDGAGLGTLGLSERRAEEMARAAGFSRFERLDIDHSVNAFYEIRP